MSMKKTAFALVPAHQVGYLRTVCQAASLAAARAQESASAARLKLADSLAQEAVPAADVQQFCRLQRDAIQKVNIVLFFGQLYVAAFRAHSPRGPSLGWDDGCR